MPPWFVLIALAGCSPSDHELFLRAEREVDAGVEKGQIEMTVRDSLVVEHVIDVFCKAKRGEGLIEQMKNFRHFDNNPSTLFGIAVGYGLEKNEQEAMAYLAKCVEMGDDHLYTSENNIVFRFLEGVPEFQILYETSKTNRYKKVAEHKFKSIEPSFPIDD